MKDLQRARQVSPTILADIIRQEIPMNTRVSLQKLMVTETDINCGQVSQWVRVFEAKSEQINILSVVSAGKANIVRFTYWRCIIQHRHGGKSDTQPEDGKRYRDPYRVVVHGSDAKEKEQGRSWPSNPPHDEFSLRYTRTIYWINDFSEKLTNTESQTC